MAASTRTPVVLVHGWAGSAESWQPIVDALDATVWDPIALRLPGSRSGPSGPATVSCGADLLVSLMRELPAPAVLVGHSMGAQVTLLAHAAAPELVHSEVVIDPAYAADPESRDEMASWAVRIEDAGLSSVADFFASASVGLTEARARQVREDLAGTAPAVIASYLRSEYVDPDAIGLNPATARVAAERRRPVLSVHSTVDSVRREASLPATPGSRPEFWDGHGHYLHLEDPGRFADLLVRWRDSAVVPAARDAARGIPSARLLRPGR